MKMLREACLAIVLVAALAVGACGGGSSPGTPTGVVPSATPTPAPTPTPTPTPVALTCTLPPRVDCGVWCCRDGGSPLFDVEVRAAQEAVRLEQPEMFGTDGSVIVEDQVYTAAVAARITSMFGLCAIGGSKHRSTGNDEVGVKRDQKLSQNLDLILGNTRQPGIYRRFTCQPASF